MRRFAFTCLALLLVATAVVGQQERVYTFHADISIEVSGRIVVREEIKVYAAGDEFKRGITRALPLTREGVRDKVSYKVQRVLQDGVEVNFFTEREGGYLMLYVGDRDVFLDPGYYRYEVFYTSDNQLGFFEEFDELYWNVNGLSDKPIDRVSCRVSVPEGAEIRGYSCYTGRHGATTENCRSSDEELHSFTSVAEQLAPEEVLTVAVAFTPGIVRHRDSFYYEKSNFEKYGLLYITLALIGFLGWYYMTTWRKYGIDPPKPTVIPLFNPPKGISPAGAGMLHQGLYSSELITATLVQLAVKGFIQIREEEMKRFMGLSKETDYELVRLKESEEGLSSEEKQVMRKLFKDKGQVKITGKYNKDVEGMMNAFASSLNAKYNSILREGMNLKYHIVPWLLLPVYIYFLIGFYRYEPSGLIETYLGSLLVMLLPALVIAFLLSRIIKQLRREVFNLLVGFVVMGGTAGVLTRFPFASLSPNALGVLLGVPILTISYLLYARLIVRPSERKLAMLAEIEGLKMYMDVAEHRQMQYFNPPEMTPEVFEELLPYAIALRMDKIWGEKFQRQFLDSLAPTVPPYQPMWYVGRAMNPALFGQSMRNSLYSNVRLAQMNPSSSAGSWSSGTGGGGFAGGGGGGGRVGGW